MACANLDVEDKYFETMPNIAEFTLYCTLQSVVGKFTPFNSSCKKTSNFVMSIDKAK